MNYEEDMRIDETALDVEWLEQAPLSIKYGKHFAECKRRVSEAEEEIKVIRSELIKKANGNPERYCGKEKPNAADIEAYYRNHKDHKDAKQELIDLEYERDMAEIAKNEVSFTRKAALENLVDLYIAQYFAGPKLPRDIASAARERRDQKEADKGVGSKMTRRRKT